MKLIVTNRSSLQANHHQLLPTTSISCGAHAHLLSSDTPYITVAWHLTTTQGEECKNLSGLTFAQFCLFRRRKQLDFVQGEAAVVIMGLLKIQKNKQTSLKC